METNETEVRLLIEDDWYREESGPRSGAMRWAKVTKPQVEYSNLTKLDDGQWLLTTVSVQIGQRNRLFPTVEAALEQARGPVARASNSTGSEAPNLRFRSVRF